MQTDCSTGEEALNREEMTRAEMRRVLKRHYGVQADIARELGVTSVAIMNWLKDKFESQRIAEAVHQRCLLLRQEERAKRGAA